MRIAYLILAHDEPELLGRMVRKLQSPQTDIFVHIDKKRDIETFKKHLPDNVIFIDNRIDVNHGGFSLTRSMLALLEAAARKNEYDVYQFLSGRDYPLKPVSELVAFYEAHAGKDFISSYELTSIAPFWFNIYNYHFVDYLARIQNKKLRHICVRLKQMLNQFGPKRAFLSGITPYRGSQWLALSQKSTNAILDFLKTAAGQKFYNHFKLSWGSDEIFFQTAIQHLKPSPIEKKLHYIDWSETREDPAVFDDRDWDALTSTPKLYARKFSSEKSAGILDRLDARN